MKDVKELLDRIGYEFKDTALLTNALTHSSYSSEHKMEYASNNERLEFIGDAYVDAAVGAELFRIMKDAPEGVLSKNRADVVREESLADAARGIGLGDYIYMGKGEETTGGRDKDSILADAFEALIGAIIVDGGYEAGKIQSRRADRTTTRLSMLRSLSETGSSVEAAARARQKPNRKRREMHLQAERYRKCILKG